MNRKREKRFIKGYPEKCIRLTYDEMVTVHALLLENGDLIAAKFINIEDLLEDPSAILQTAKQGYSDYWLSKDTDLIGENDLQICYICNGNDADRLRIYNKILRS